MKTSFCITAMNRRSFIERTLPHNLALAADPARYEIVLLDYNSMDDLGDYVRATFADQMRRGVLAYYHTNQPPRYYPSHAKNCSHRLATGDIVVNLDADNFLVLPYFNHLAGLQRGEMLKTHGHYNLGGRLAMYRDDFETIGGYDETLTQGWGGEDEDLVARWEQHGFSLRSVVASEAGAHIDHSDEERVVNCEVHDKHVSWNAHREISRLNIARGALIANQGRAWGQCRVTKNFTEEIDTHEPAACDHHR